MHARTLMTLHIDGCILKHPFTQTLTFASAVTGDFSNSTTDVFAAPVIPAGETPAKTLAVG